jgi:tetratricopeptide (TPR) repeat protein
MPAFAQRKPADSATVARARHADSLKMALKHRTDSIAAIRKYKESKRYQDSVLRVRQRKIDSVSKIRKAYTDSVSAARKKIMDSSFAARKLISDAAKAKMKRRTDSLAKIRKYRESKRYTDSVARVRNMRLDSIRLSRQKVIDSARNARKIIIDSAIAARKKISDSSRAVLKRRSDSLAAIRKYRESKRFRDSVQVVRQSRLDSIKAVRKIFMDSITAVRKKTLDSMTKMRKARMDSLTAARKSKTDSLEKIRAARADSLAKKKELREKELKAEQKRKEDKLKLAFELKMKKKHEAWSNEKMLKKKWRFPRRSFQNMFTRYNYYYNANRKMEEATRNMQRRKKDDFEQRITLFPFDPNKDSTVFAADMDTIVRKASIGIQIHDPRTKWADDLYILMGQSYYYKGNYNMAESVFKYVIGMKNTSIYKNVKKKAKSVSKDGSPLEKEQKGILSFLKHRSVHNDAVLWLTRTYTDSKRISEAEAILDLLDASSGVTESMKGKIALERANLYIQQGATRAAGEQLAQVMRSKAIDKYTRQRASFLNGQLQMDLGIYDSATIAFKKNISLHPAIDMDFYARKLMASAISESGGDATQSMMALKHLLKDGKYAPYYEQVYFILGRLAANSGKDDEAIENFTLSLRQPKTSKKQKAISFASIGNIQYRRGEYTKAQKSYDSASYFSKGVEDNADVSLAIRRAKSLDKIKDPSLTLKNQDSLLRLSTLSEKEQRANAKRYLKYLEKQKEDSAALASAPAAADAGSGSGMPGSGSSGWYFSNTTLVQQGFNDFKRKWGNRPLADNWRRGAALSGLPTAGAGGADADQDTAATGDEVTEETLLAAIPKKESEKAAIQKRMRLAYLKLAAAYIDDVEEYKEALKTLDSLDAKFPGHEFPDQVLSLRYKAHLRLNQLEEAEKMRNELLEKYPVSEFAKNLSGAADTTTTSTTEAVGTYFETTYQSLMDRDYNLVLSRAAKAQRTYGDPVYARKFRIMEAMAYVGSGQYKTADSLIEKYVKEYPADSLRPWADAIVKVIKEQRAADTLGDSAKVMIPKVLADSALAKVAAPTVPVAFSYKPKSNHYVIFLFGKPDAKTAGFRSGIGDYSMMKTGKSLEAVQQMLNAEQCMVVCKVFSNAKSANSFLTNALKEPLLFRELPKGSYSSFIISEENFRKLVADKSADEYRKFAAKNYR